METVTSDKSSLEKAGFIKNMSSLCSVHQSFILFTYKVKLQNSISWNIFCSTVTVKKGLAYFLFEVAAVLSVSLELGANDHNKKHMQTELPSSYPWFS